MKQLTVWMPMIVAGAWPVWGVAGPALGREGGTANQPINLPSGVDESASVGSTAAGRNPPAATKPTSRAFAKESQPLGGKRPKRSLWPGKGSSVDFGGEKGHWQGLLSLAAVLGLIGVLAYVARRWLPGVKSLRAAGLQVLGQTHLSPKQSIALVRMGRLLVLVGITPERISQLAIVDDPREAAEILADLKCGKPGGAMEEGFNPALAEALEAYRPQDELEDEDENDSIRSHPATYDQTRGQIQGLLEKVKSLTVRGRAG